MNNIDLPAMIRDCVDGGTRQVTLGEVKARAALPARPGLRGHMRRGHMRREPMRRGPKLAVGVTGLAAAGAAAALVVSQAGGGQVPTRTVLTAAVIRHMARTSQAAMSSGQADIIWTSSGLPSVVEQITFDGTNWNDVLNPGMPMKITRTGKFVTQTGESINRVVDGQDYHYPAVKATPSGPDFTPSWMRIDGPGAGRGLSIPDPRTLLSVLSPSAGFVTDGTGSVNGVPVSRLRAATSGGVPAAPLDNIIQSEPDGARISAIDLWVDADDVVLKAEITVTGTNGSGAPQSATVTVTFSHIGQPQPITAPATYTTFGGKG
jgi:hypothetical protein